MDSLIPKLYKEYGLYVNQSRALPLDVDGLKPVERRVLLTTNQIARDKFVKSAKVDGATLGQFHPHSSCYGTLVQLVNRGFIDGQGNFGNNIGIESSPAAAMRYTECKLSKMTYKMALELIDYVKWVESELDDEPEFLPTMFPFCLIGNKNSDYVTGIGFGFKTLIPCYNIEDLKNRLLFLLGKTKESPIIKPITDCEILSSDEELEKLLTTGKTSISFRGIYLIDKIRNRVVVKSLPPGKKFESILSKFEKELNNQDIGWIDESSGDNGGTHIVFEVLKSRNRDEIFKSFIKKLPNVLTSNISFEIVVVSGDSKSIKTSSVDDMLINTFKTYLEINMKMLKSNEEKINFAIAEVKLLEKIKTPLLKYLKEKDLSYDDIVEKISNDIKEDNGKIKDLLRKHRISKLLTFKADYESLNERLNVVKNNINNIGDFIIDKYNNL